MLLSFGNGGSKPPPYTSSVGFADTFPKGKANNVRNNFHQKRYPLAKHKKKKKKQVAVTEAKKKKPFPKKRLFTLLSITALIFTAYQVMIALEFAPAVHIYWIGLGVLAAAYIVVNRASFKPLTYDDLSDELTNAEKDEIIREQARRLEKSRPILYAIIGVIFTLLFDTAYLYATINLGLKL